MVNKKVKNCQNGPKLSKMVYNGLNWSEMVKNGGPDLKRARRTGLSGRRARRTKSRGPKGLQLEVGPRRGPLTSSVIYKRKVQPDGCRVEFSSGDVKNGESSSSAKLAKEDTQGEDGTL